MYTLEINFLNDRAAPEALAVERKPIADSQFLIYGGAVAVVALALVGGAFLFLNSANEGLQQELAKLTATETSLTSKIKSLEDQEKQLQAIQDRTNQILNLFVGNLPVSAVIDDLRRRTPLTVQIKSITQQTAAAAAPQASSQSTITLNGTATNYNELNDYILLLKSSPLLDSDKTKLVSSTLQPATTDKNFTLVDFQILVTTTSKSPAELLAQLQKLGADGLVARVNLLRQKGVIK
ncbi:MAG: PilN domain-containing protein [Pseudanabaena sp.]|jgi:type IV pilus assembly protein PilN|uniref:PilN domain-containing protein n=1 Tax=Pseudanabaena mucicola TaxID=71190 RepID=UPI0025791A5E|nr:PilN domain-containing protein [Pseudanabaena mucicola]MCA6575725.1 PilN domain-containing protein [Pseudanabaena sp. M53BS1SP1A06MG]MCA6587595.1 PilN domain-containing protein [Pseudanabaena sp. M051S1SP1A06QC]MCA6590247.1 PilN domain-containing protein [Pseudanabaena sp. M109S1SP1A06QC]MCA6597675.1 PilN domain-containing protein [Pseudanabaena sp. M046S1SP1A06QC]MCA6606280.1 PilN domain-containing protein [Pseudanabaena sp. M007S1SP1A06QC]MCA6615927.1 PilN domain-containing protein [Pseu